MASVVMKMLLLHAQAPWIGQKNWGTIIDHQLAEGKHEKCHRGESVL
jgi:hypothetical protein